jgi:hypothetical protein
VTRCLIRPGEGTGAGADGAGAAVKIHDSAHRTHRVQIQHAGPTAIAEAMARCIDDARTSAPDVPVGQRTAAATRCLRCPAVQ